MALPGVLTTGLLFAIWATPVHAASQGGLGPTSTGTIGVSVTIPASVYLQGETEQSIDLQSDSATHTACLTGKGIDAVTLVADGGDTGFTVTASDGTDIAYVPALNGKAFLTAPIEVAAPGDCVSMQLSAQPADPAAVKDDESYTGVLTLIVKPE